MIEIAWDDSLSVGINLIDQQHQALIQKIAAIDEAIKERKGVGKVLQTLAFMTEYTDFHFSTEEKNMRKYEYPYTDAHIKQHEEFKQMLETLRYDFEEEGATTKLSESIRTYLMNWLVNHIKGIDVKFGEFLREFSFTMDE